MPLAIFSPLPAAVTAPRRLFGTSGGGLIFCVPGDFMTAAAELERRGIVAAGPWPAHIASNRLNLFSPGELPAVAWQVGERDRARLDGAGMLDPTRRIG